MKETGQQMRARAVEILQGFEFKPMTVDEFATKLDAWRCKKPGTSMYAFDIMISRYGISIVGDVENLTFRVGASYGMPFLAGEDIDYYIYSKLDHVFYDKKDFDGDRFMEGAAIRLGNALYDDLNGDAPEWMINNAKGGTAKKLKDWLERRPKKMVALPRDFVAIFARAASVGTVYDAVEFLRSEELFGDPEGWPTYSMPSQAIRQELYLINEAARRIMLAGS